MGKQGESHHIPPSVPSPESGALGHARRRARARASQRQTIQAAFKTEHFTKLSKHVLQLTHGTSRRVKSLRACNPLRLKKSGADHRLRGEYRSVL